MCRPRYTRDTAISAAARPPIQTRRAGITTVDDIAEAGEDELVRLLGKAHGQALYAMALAHDERPVVAERETKSVSVEDTYDVDIHDRLRVGLEVRRLADRCVRRLREAGLSGRTIVLKVRRYDFSTLKRSETLRGPTDDPAVVREAAARLLDAVDTTGGVRLLGVGVSGLADYTQEDLFAQAAGEGTDAEHLGEEGHEEPLEERAAVVERRWPAGHGVRHAEHPEPPATLRGNRQSRGERLFRRAAGRRYRRRHSAAVERLGIAPADFLSGAGDCLRRSQSRGAGRPRRAPLSGTRRDDPSGRHSAAGAFGGLALLPPREGQPRRRDNGGEHPLVTSESTRADGLMICAHEPSLDPARMQAFRQREVVYAGVEVGAVAHRDLWADRAAALPVSASSNTS